MTTLPMLTSASALLISVSGLIFLNSKLNQNLEAMSILMKSGDELQSRFDRNKKIPSQITQLAQMMKQSEAQRNELSQKLSAFQYELSEVVDAVSANSEAILEMQEKLGTDDIKFSCKLRKVGSRNPREYEFQQHRRNRIGNTSSYDRRDPGAGYGNPSRLHPPKTVRFDDSIRNGNDDDAIVRENMQRVRDAHQNPQPGNY